MIIRTNEDTLRLYKDCSAWEKSCLKERLYNGCDFNFSLSAQDYNFLSTLSSSAEVPDALAERAFGNTFWSDEDFLR